MSFFKKLFGRKQEVKEEIIEKEITQEDANPLEEIQEAIEEAVEESLEVIETLEAEEEIQPIKEVIEEVVLQVIEESIVEEDTHVQESEEEDTDSEEAVVEEDTHIKESVVEEDTHSEEPVVEEDTYSEESVLEEVTRIEDHIAIEEVISQESTTEETLEEETFSVIEEVQEEAKPKKKGLFSKLFSGLAKTRDNILGSVDDVLKNFKKIDEELYEELEEALIMADFGVDTTLAIMEDLRRIVKERKITEPSELKTAIQEIITNILTAHVTSPIIVEDKPNVVLVIGVNGVGKTTTIGKLANQLQSDNKKVILAAADTFRAAAIEQLQIWADRAHVDLIKQQEGSDPASVVYDGIKAAKSRKADVLICDTAGRLQNKTNLMKELEKIARIIDREYPEAHKEVLIVLDATTGQNAISQVKVFKEAAKVDGIILTKLDGTAKGGAIVGICQSLGVPVKYIGVGEKIDDLQVFDPQSFARALFNVE